MDQLTESQFSVAALLADMQGLPFAYVYRAIWLERGSDRPFGPDVMLGELMDLVAAGVLTVAITDYSLGASGEIDEPSASEVDAMRRRYLRDLAVPSPDDVEETDRELWFYVTEPGVRLLDQFIANQPAR